jgi:prepilin signal peptidase PulO-like enzyme (type II secretory pathway)
LELAVIAFLIGAYCVLFAALLGSFINLAADRLPRGESILTPRSHCRSCGRVLNAVDLLPVLGYLVRGGRCATCATPIGVASPLVEAVCAGSMLAAILWLGLWPGALVGLALVGAGGAVLTGLAMRRATERRATT